MSPCKDFAKETGFAIKNDTLKHKITSFCFTNTKYTKKKLEIILHESTYKQIYRCKLYLIIKSNTSFTLLVLFLKEINRTVLTDPREK